jgi:hypothetical protein
MDDKDEGAVRIATLMLVLFVSVSTVLGLVLPDKNASYPHAMAMLADFVAAVVPSIDGFALVSSFPVATKMFLAVQWLSLPLLAALIRMVPGLTKPNQRTLQRFSRFKVGLLTIAIVRLVGHLCSCLYHRARHELCTRAVWSAVRLGTRARPAYIPSASRRSAYVQSVALSIARPGSSPQSRGRDSLR